MNSFATPLQWWPLVLSPSYSYCSAPNNIPPKGISDAAFIRLSFRPPPPTLRINAWIERIRTTTPSSQPSIYHGDTINHQTKHISVVIVVKSDSAIKPYRAMLCSSKGEGEPAAENKYITTIIGQYPARANIRTRNEGVVGVVVHWDV